MNFTIETRAQFVPGESDPVNNRYVFAYTITIRNHGDEAGRLVSRHWWVTDGQGEVQEVQGPGVVGQQPRIPPGDSFRYTSAALLPTPVGAMHGHYDFETDEGEAFEVPIPAFSLWVPTAVH